MNSVIVLENPRQWDCSVTVRLGPLDVAARATVVRAIDVAQGGYLVFIPPDRAGVTLTYHAPELWRLTETYVSLSASGGTPKSCPPLGQCYQQGECDPGDGQCKAVLKPDGTPCPDGTCQQGTCQKRRRCFFCCTAPTSEVPPLTPTLAVLVLLLRGAWRRRR